MTIPLGLAITTLSLENKGTGLFSLDRCQFDINGKQFLVDVSLPLVGQIPNLNPKPNIVGSEQVLSYKLEGLPSITKSESVISGGLGIDYFQLPSSLASYTWSLSFDKTLKSVKFDFDSSRSYLLDGVERLKFSNKALAIDLDGNSGNAARLLATVFGKEAVKNPTYAGIAISLFDQGYSKDQVSQVALNAVFGANPKSKEIVSMIWKNLTGLDIDSENLAELSGLIDSKAITAAQLATKAADLDLTAQVIDLVGLSKTGWEYIPYGG